MPNEAYENYTDVKERLDQIVDAVNADDLPLDEALSLYEEAVKLGLRASDLIEQDTEARRAAEQGEEAEPGDTAEAEPGAAAVPGNPGEEA